MELTLIPKLQKRLVGGDLAVLQKITKLVS